MVKKYYRRIKKRFVRRYEKRSKPSKIYVDILFAIGIWIYIYLKDFLGYKYLDRVVGILGLVIGIVSLYITLRIMEEQNEYTYYMDRPKLVIENEDKKYNSMWSIGEDSLKIKIVNVGETHVNRIKVRYINKVDYQKLSEYIEYVNGIDTGIEIDITEEGNLEYRDITTGQITTLKLNREVEGGAYYSQDLKGNGVFYVGIPKEVLRANYLKIEHIKLMVRKVEELHKRKEKITDLGSIHEIHMGILYKNEYNEEIIRNLEYKFGEGNLKEEKVERLGSTIECIKGMQNEVNKEIEELKDIIATYYNYINEGNNILEEMSKIENGGEEVVKLAQGMVKTFMEVEYIGSDNNTRIDIIRLYLDYGKVKENKEEIVEVYEEVNYFKVKEHVEYWKGKHYIEDSILNKEE